MLTVASLAGAAPTAGAQTGTALVRHAPVVHGRVEGSLRQMNAEPFALGGDAVIAGELLVPGTPAIRTSGKPMLGGTIDATGSASPSDYALTLGGTATLGRIRRRVDPRVLPSVTAPLPPAGTRDVILRPGATDPGAFATVRDLTVAGNAGQLAVPPGAYGVFTAGPGSGFTLGVAGAAEPAGYHFQQLVLHARAELRVIGPVIVTLAGELAAGGSIGAADRPGWLTLNIPAGGLVLNGGAEVHGYVNAPDSAVTIEGNARLVGGVIADRLAVRGGGLLRLVNRAPRANAGSVAGTEDGSIQIILTASDPDDDPLSFAVTAVPAHGTLGGTPPNLTYVPSPDYAGADRLTFKARDGHEDSNAATIVIAVAAVNDPPQAEAKSLAVAEDTPGEVVLSGSDVDGDGLTFAIVTPPTHGSLAGTSAQRIYTPAPDYHGTDSFRYAASDGALNSEPVTVAIVVTPVNDPPAPVARSLAATAGVPVPIVLAATDPDGDTLTFAITSGPAHGTLAGTAPNLTYMAASDYEGSDGFTFTASDGRAVSPAAAVSITVAPPPNRPPRITSAPPTSMELRAERGAAGMLRGVIRDFSKNHPNFEENLGNQSSTFVVPGLVAPFLGEDRKPIPLNLGQGGSSTDTPANFNQWYRDVPGVNHSRRLELPIAETAPGSGIYGYRSDAFFPIDGEFYGSEGLTDGQSPHNFNFTCEFHTRFVYQPGQTITFGGDDAVWVFVDDRLVIDLGGVHLSTEKTAGLDGLGLVPGRSYPMDIFHAEQHTGGSSFRLRTSMAFETAETYRYAVAASDPDGDALTYSLTGAPLGMSIDPQTGVITWTVDRANAGQHAVAVQVRDPAGRTATQTYSLDVYVNTPPAIAWGSRFHAGRVGDPVLLAPAITDDGHPGGQPLAIEWKKLSGPGTVAFSAPNASSTGATFSAAGLYVVQVAATDGTLSSASTAEVRVDLAGSALSGRQATSWWPGNDTPEDIIGGRHGEPLFGAAYGPGRVGSAFVFDGIDDIVRVRASADLDVGAAAAGFSIGFWMRCEIDTPMATVLGWRTVTGVMGTSITMDNYLGTRRMYLNLRTAGDTDVRLGGEQMWPLNEWVHVTFTYDRASGVARVYRDGAPKLEQVVGSLKLSTSADFWWGALTGFNGNFFRGRIDELMIHRRALSTAEVYAVYAAAAGSLPPSGNEPPVINAGPDLAPRGIDQTVLLEGTVSDDGRPANGVLDVQWSMVSGPAAAVFAAPESARTAVTLPVPGTYVGRLSASDGEAVAEDFVQIKVGELTTARPEGLVAWWPGNDTPQDVVAGLDGTWSNAPAYVTGMVGDAFQFDGKRRVTVPASPSLNAEGWPGLSLEFWIHPTTPAAGGRVFVGWRNPAGAAGVTVRLAYHWGWLLAIDLNDTTGAPHSFSIAGGVTLDEWQHLVVTYDRTTGFARVYRNGAQVHEAALGVFTPQTGFDLHWGSVGDESFRGRLDELSVYRRALTSGEAQALYRAGAAGKEPAGPNLAPVVAAGPDQIVRGMAEPVTLDGSVSDDGLPVGNGLISRWKRLSGAGTATFGDPARPATTVTFDQPGIHVLELEADDGLTKSAATVEIRVGPFSAAASPPDIVAWWPGNNSTREVIGGRHAEWIGPPGYAPGMVGSAPAFDGSRHIRVPASGGLSSNGWPGLTLEFWIRPGGMPLSGTGAALLEWRHPNGSAGVSVGMRYWNGWNLDINLADTAGQPHSLGANGALAPGVWQHLAMAYDRASGWLQVYRNAILMAEAKVGSFTPQTGYDLLWAPPGSARFLGELDEIAMYRRALTPAEVTAVHAAGASGKTRPIDNSAPVVNAGADILMAGAAAPAVLHGSVTDDSRPFGTTTSLWSASGAPTGATVTFADPTQPATTAAVSTAGTYLLRLTASDGYTQPQSDTVELRVAAGAADSPSDIAAWWPANGTAVDVVGRRDAGLFSGATFAGGRVLQGFAFDGIASFVRVDGHPNLDIGASAQGLTIEFWMRTDVAADRPLFAWMSDTGQSEYVRAWSQGGGRAVNVWLRGTDGQDRVLYGPSTLAVGQFAHIAITYDRVTGIGRLFYNGAAVDQRSLGLFTPDTAASRRLWIGSRSDVRNFKGVIDEFTLYRRPLAPAEIAAVAAAGPNGKSPPDENGPPTVDAGPDLALQSSVDPVALDGVVRDDGLPFGAPIVQWRVRSGPAAVTFADPTNPATRATFGMPGTYLLELSASDGLLAPVSDTVEVRLGVAVVEPPAGISVWWPGNLHSREVMAGNANLELLNGAAYAGGRVLHGFSFDGLDDYARAPAHADTDVGASAAGFTVEFWARPAENRDGMILSWGGPNVVGLSVYQWASGREIEVNFRDRSTSADRTLRTSGYALSAGQWTHVAITHLRTTGEMRLYINGVMRAASYLGTAAVRTQFGLTLGRNAWDAGLAWKGTLDEPALYGRPLGPEEIAALHAAGPDGKSPPDTNTPPVVNAGPDIALPDTGAVAILNGSVVDDHRPFGPPTATWRMIAGPGSVTFGDPGKANTTAVFGTPGTYLLELSGSDGYVAPASDLVEVRVGVGTAEAFAGISAWWPGNRHSAEFVSSRAPLELMFGATYGSGRVLQGFVFDGVDDFGRVASHSDIDVGSSAAGFSVEFWINPPENRDGMILSWGAPNFVGLAIYQYAAGREIEVNFRDRATSADRALRTSGAALSPGRWTHIAVTQDRSTGEIRIYVDGVVRASAVSAAFAVRTQSNLVFGRNAWDPGFAWKGVLDEPALYKRPLSAAEIQRIVAAGPDGKSLLAFNEPPRVSAGADVLVADAATPVSLNGIVVDDRRPFGAPLVGWSVVAAPGTVTFADAAAARTTATFERAGTYRLKLTGTDRFALPVSDLVDVFVGVAAPPPANNPPLVFAGADIAGHTNAAIPLAGFAADDGLPAPPGGLTYQWSHTSGPGNVVFSAATNAATTATFDTAGTHTLRFTATDSSLTAADDLVVTLTTPASQPPAVAIVEPRNNAAVPAGVPVNLIATASDPDGSIAGLEFILDGVSLGMAAPLEGRTGHYSLPTTFAASAEPATLVARATDNTGVVTHSLPVTVRVLADPGPPFAEITAPDEDTRIAGPVQVVGVADSSLLAHWVLEHRLKAAEGAPAEPWTAFATGTEPVGRAPSGPTPLVPATFGTFDPTRLLNGIHELRLRVTDTAGRTQIAGPFTVLVEGSMKIGVFTLAFEDLKVPVAGIPITLTRTYDSRDARVGDFGPGWRLAVNNVRVQKNRHLGNGWWQTPQQGSGLQFYHVEPVNERIVTVVMPDGETHRFRAGALVKNREGDPDNASFAMVVRQGRYRFYPIGDTTGKLEPLDASNQLAEVFFIAGTGDQDLSFDEFGFNPFNTSRYRLTTREGLVLIVDEALGLIEMRDANANALVLVRNGQDQVTGVTSTRNAGGGPITRSITIVRDGSGRVDYIRDTAGKDLDYLYDELGRLESFTNREMNVTQFRYENASFPHYLTKIIDPRGVAALRSEYDAAGKLVKQIDADGKETIFNRGFDPTGRFEKLKDRLGNETTFYYDGRGNVTLKIDPLGAQTSYSYYADTDRVKFETDHYGNVKSFAYDAQGNVTVQTLGASTSEDPSNPTTGYVTRTSYNAQSAPTQITDPDGRIQAFSYDPATNNLLTHTVGSGGSAPATTTYTYNSDGTLATVTDALGNVTSHAYDETFRDPAYPGVVKQITVTVRDPAGPAGSDPSNATETVLRRTRTVFDAQENQLAQIVTRTLANGGAEDVVTRYVYDAENRLRATLMPDGRVTETRYTSFGRQDKQLLWRSLAEYQSGNDALARVTSYSYDSRGNQVGIVHADGTSESMLFDAEHRRTWSQDRRGYRTFFVYDAVGRLRFTIHPDANDGMGSAAPASATDPRLADNPRSETQYDLIGRVRFQLDERGAKTEFTYEDNCGCFARRKQTIQHRAAGNLITQWGYDRAGNVRFVTDPRGNTVETRYDDHGRPERVIYPATDEHPVTHTETRYDPLGRRVETIDQEGRSTRHRYDALGRLVEVRQYLDGSARAADADFSLAAADPRVVVTRYTYDELGSQTSQIDALGRTTRYESDNVGRRTRRILPRDPSEPSALSEILQYDSWGNLWKRTDFSGQTTTFGYDALNRLTSKTADPRHASLGYSHAAARIEFDYDENGARKSARTFNAAGTLLYSEATPRDERGRLHFKEISAGGRLDYSYHPNGLLRDVVSSNPGGVNLGYRYDELNRLEYVDDAANGGPPRTTQYTYNPNSAVETIVQPNGIVHAYTYDTLGRLRTLVVNTALAVTGGPAVGTVHHVYDYRLRASGHRQQDIENTTKATTYDYDGIYRLTSETVTGDAHGNDGVIRYSLDKVGNRSARTSSVAPVPSVPSQTYNARDWLEGDSYTPNGSTVTSPSLPQSLAPFADTYDFEERLIVRTRIDGRSVNIVYDADGHRIRKNILGSAGAPVSTTSWLVDTNNLTGYAQVFEERESIAANGINPASSRVVVYTYGRDLISRAEDVETRTPRLETRYFTFDGQRSARELADSAGNVTDRYDYDAFGLLIFRSGTSANTHLYRGEQYDPDLGLYYLRARYLNPDRGRFWTMDAYEGAAEVPLSLHKYGYADGNPVMYSDPSGHVSLVEVQIGMVIVSTLNGLALNSGRNTLNQANGIFSPAGELNDSLATIEQAMFVYEQLSLMAAAGGASVLAKRGLQKAWNAVAPTLGKALTALSNANPTKLIQAQLGRLHRATAKGAGYATRYEPAAGIEIAPGAGLSVTTKPDSAAFWSGRGGANRAAAEASGLTTLESTPAGQALETQDLFSRLPYVLAVKPWERLAEQFASAAQGTVNAWTGGASPTSVWNRIERPALLHNAEVKKIIIRDATQPWSMKVIYK